MLHTVKKVSHIDGHKLRLLFNDGSVKIVDLGDMLKEAKNMMAPLAKVDYFKKVKCDGSSIYWPNGVDLCPDVLYDMGEEVRPVKKNRRSALSVAGRKGSKLGRP